MTALVVRGRTWRRPTLNTAPDQGVDMSFIIAIVGRPNVGKSRLFNRLTDAPSAIVHDTEGVTRDRQYGDGTWYERRYTVVDTGGFVPQTDDPMLRQMRQQAQLALDEADAIFFVVDGREGLTAADDEIGTMLRRSDKPVFGVVNKVDRWTGQEEFLVDFYELGLDLYPVSAEHGVGIEELMDSVTDEIPDDEEHDETPFARLAVVGKPNVGKSSLVNAFLGEDRLLTSEVAGTTRDSVDTRVVIDDEREYLVMDTAGLRRKSKVSEELEEYSVIHAIRSIDRADIALLVLDPTDELSRQDKKIATVIQNRGRGCVLVVNKWDLIEKTGDTAGEFAHFLRHDLGFVDYAPIVFVSALTGQRVHGVFDVVDEVFEQYQRRIPTSEVNNFLEAAVARHSPPTHNNKRPNLFYATQVGTRPPSFMFSVNSPKAVAPAYRKYLTNQLRETYGFNGVPIQTVFRKR